MDILQRVLRSNGQWTHTVRSEVHDKSAEWTDLASVPSMMTNDVLLPTKAEAIHRAVIRDDLAKPGDRATDNLGEAESFAVASSRFADDQVFVMTEDNYAAAYARDRLGFQVIGTKTVMEMAAKLGHITLYQANQFCRDIRAEGRPVRDFPPPIA
jgi:predicted nucleic acid-binding protein